MDKKYAREKTAELLKLVGLEGKEKQKIKSYSGGMRRRLGIAQALLNDPKILIMDEPTAGLDPKERVRFRKLIAGLGRDRIVILSTHIVSDVEAIADSIYVMKGGRLLAQGSSGDLERTVENKVWLYEGKPEDEDRIAEHYLITNVHHEDDHSIYRIVSDEKPFPEAAHTDGTLEDLYLYYFNDGGAKVC